MEIFVTHSFYCLGCSFRFYSDVGMILSSQTFYILLQIFMHFSAHICPEWTLAVLLDSSFLMVILTRIVFNYESSKRKKGWILVVIPDNVKSLLVKGQINLVVKCVVFRCQLRSFSKNECGI